MPGNTEQPNVLYGTFKVLVADKSGTDRRDNKGIVTFSHCYRHHEPPLNNASELAKVDRWWSVVLSDLINQWLHRNVGVFTATTYALEELLTTTKFQAEYVFHYFK